MVDSPQVAFAFKQVFTFWCLFKIVVKLLELGESNQIDQSGCS